MGLNVSANTEHVFGFKNEKFAHTSTNIVDLESFYRRAKSSSVSKRASYDGSKDVVRLWVVLI